METVTINTAPRSMLCRAPWSLLCLNSDLPADFGWAIAAYIARVRYVLFEGVQGGAARYSTMQKAKGPAVTQGSLRPLCHNPICLPSVQVGMVAVSG